MAGRITLIQAVTASIPTYAMQTAKLPSSACAQLDKLNRNFLWGDTSARKKIHLLIKLEQNLQAKNPWWSGPEKNCRHE